MKSKSLWICRNCKSYKVQVKEWKYLNNFLHTVDNDSSERGDYWCEDCEQHEFPALVEYPLDSKFLGFQLVHKNNEKSQLEDVHIYPIEQAKQILLDYKEAVNWKLKGIWSHEHN
tara:strand:- start:529 stop:873 length:345 start_codon:yes stop_codon:yes gene_type:complete